ncbi:MAG TPA: HPP family protein [Dokdonella sp.]
MLEYLTKWRGGGAQRPAHAGAAAILLAGLGGFVAIGTLAVLTTRFDVLLLLGSFGASCVLLFGYPDAPFAQPANVIGGHLISTLIGLAALHICGVHPWSLGLAVGGAVMAMMATRTVHPPAGSNPVIVFLSQPGWSFVFFPVLTGAVVLVLIALVYNNAVRKHRYPAYW